jgi:hypothetical protein
MGYQPGAVQFSSYDDNWVGGGPPGTNAPMTQPQGTGQVGPINTESGVGYIDHDGTVVTRSELEEDDGELVETPLEQAIRRGLRSSWLRVDYLNWSLGDSSGETRGYDLTEIGLHDTPGIQATVGLPMTFGSFELSGFLLGQASVDVLASNFEGESDTFVTRFTSDVWGADLNFVMDPYMPGEGFKCRPMGGFRYFAIQESMKIPGETSSGDPWAKSETFNNIVAPQFGVRFELVHRWFTIGAEPKVGFGVNTILTEIRDKGLFDVNDAHRETEFETAFAPYGDFDVYARIPCGEHFSLFVSYNLVVMAGVSRPFDAMTFSSSDGFQQDQDTRSYRMEGYTLGGEFIF